MTNSKVQKALDCVVETVNKPSNIPTGEAISDFVKVLVKTKPDVKGKEVIQILEDAGFNRAEKIGCFIEAQVERTKLEYR